MTLNDYDIYESSYDIDKFDSSMMFMKKFIRHAGSNTNITMTTSMQRQIHT